MSSGGEGRWKRSAGRQKRHKEASEGFLGETMVGLNPSKFYGRVLPRPRIYCDVKFSDARVDPPEGVNAALLEWAGDANWNRGGTSSTRKRMSGKVEGRMSKLRAMDESDDEEEPSPKKPAKGRQALSFGNSKMSQATNSPKIMTPIERMLASPATSKGEVTPNRRTSCEFFVPRKRSQPAASEVKCKRRKKASQRELVLDSDNDSDDGLDEFMEKLEASKDDPNHSTRRSARLQESTPKTPQTPEVGKNSPPSKASRNRRNKAVAGSSNKSLVALMSDVDSESESESGSHSDSDSE